MAGVGKTELACGFARWLEETQGRTGKIFFLSFEHGATLSSVINQVGREIWDDKFFQYQAEQQQIAVLQQLKTESYLLIWDNFEPIAGFPSGNEALLSQSERESLKSFLKDLRGGRSWVLITSRREEPWLNCGYSLLNLQGLREEDVEELAAKILQMAGVDRKNLPAEYLELLKLLGGHPLSLRVVLPHLKTQTPLQLIEALRQGLETLSGTEEEGRDKSLIVSLDYSFAKLSERARRHLSFLALFSERVNAEWLHAFSSGEAGDAFGSVYQTVFGEGEADDAFGSVYQTVFGENLKQVDWLRLLGEATAAGILEQIDETIYKIHPALPWYLRQQLSQHHAAQEVSELKKKLLIFYEILADNCLEQFICDAKKATSFVQVEEPNLLQNLWLAEQEQNWEIAQIILPALGEFYQRIGRQPEFKSLRQRALKKIGIHLAEAKTKGEAAFSYWVYLQSGDANEALIKGDLKEAKAIQQAILNGLLASASNTPLVDERIAGVYHHLGIIAEKQRHFDEAIDYYQKSLTIRENLQDWYGAADDYFQLGNIAKEQRHFDEARAYYQKAFEIWKNSGDWHRAALGDHQLGMVAQEQRQFDEAIDYYQKALQIYEDAKDFYSASNEYHQLGRVAVERGQLDKAMAYYKQALQIREDLGDFYNAANDCHQLGNVAYLRQKYDEAIAYYQKVRKIYEEKGDFYNTAGVYHQLGLVAQKQRQFDEAIDYYQKALQIYEDAKDFYSASNEYHQLGRVAVERGQLDKAMAYYKQAFQIRENLGDFYKAANDCLQLGDVAYLRQKYDQAIAYYQKALKVHEDAKDWYQTAYECNQLGIIFQKQHRLDEAVACFQKALKIYEKEENWDGIAQGYHNLGWVAHEQGRLDEAIAYYQEALKIYEEAEDNNKAAREYLNLGGVAYEQGQFDEALVSYQKALTNFQESKDWYFVSLTLLNFGNVLKVQKNWVKALQVYIHGYYLVTKLKHNEEWLDKYMFNLGQMFKQLGESQFDAIWREMTGEDCPAWVRLAVQAASAENEE
jgi:tetratricopeptide (TPR) repeat protein